MTQPISLSFGRLISELLSGGTIWDYLGPSRTRLQVEAGQSKLLLFETFIFFFYFLFLCFTITSCRGARAPKNYTDEQEIIHLNF